ncbi:MAG: DUF3419 family protein [Saccharospirillaceae bacterium]|nr:DUF3419 family protein [Pseudomonadales bacterium]NRB77511.1 DUF3419 family protein [Saccharospirillaceae bacterium]
MDSLNKNNQTVANKLHSSEIVRYSHVWEDYAHSFKIIELYKFNEIIMIGSGGENVFNILAKFPVNVLAVDANTQQIELIRIKQKAIQTLTKDQYISFLGLSDQYDRKELIKLLPTNSQKHQLIPAIIQHGSLFIGKLEQYFKLWSKHVADNYPDFKTAFYENKNKLKQIVDTKKFKVDFIEFFNQQNLGQGGRDEQMYQGVKIDSAEFFWNQYIKAINNLAAGVSSYFELFNFSTIKQGELPYYQQSDENYHQLRANLKNLTLKVGFLEDQLDGESCFDFAILSNIFEYLTEKQSIFLLDKLSNNMKQKSGLLYWNLLKPINASQININWLYQKQESKQMSHDDLSWYYFDVRFELLNSKIQVG